jgi:hypothetical protein
MDLRGARLDALADAYRRVFGLPGKRSADQMLVWADLAMFCREGLNTFDTDSRLSAFREGKREVILRISSALVDPEPTREQIFAQMGLAPEETPDE